MYQLRMKFISSTSNKTTQTCDWVITEITCSVPDQKVWFKPSFINFIECKTFEDFHECKNFTKIGLMGSISFIQEVICSVSFIQEVICSISFIQEVICSVSFIQGVICFISFIQEVICSISFIQEVICSYED